MVSSGERQFRNTVENGFEGLALGSGENIRIVLQ